MFFKGGSGIKVGDIYNKEKYNQRGEEVLVKLLHVYLAWSNIVFKMS